ncbi:hypothetical protein H9L39_07212 [Fusarium oxysporum f. sp. albedinis]|nr:hypothetical protein H9L39_07212 [Fusarium oxysporum f. sp. albedinis]
MCLVQPSRPIPRGTCASETSTLLAFLLNKEHGLLIEQEFLNQIKIPGHFIVYETGLPWSDQIMVIQTSRK